MLRPAKHSRSAQVVTVTTHLSFPFYAEASRWRLKTAAARLPFGNQAAVGRKSFRRSLALRPGLATGLPFSGYSRLQANARGCFQPDDREKTLGESGRQATAPQGHNSPSSRRQHQCVHVLGNENLGRVCRLSNRLIENIFPDSGANGCSTWRHPAHDPISAIRLRLSDYAAAAADPRTG
jgi:hypothetical protein